MLTQVILVESYRTGKLNISSFRYNFFLSESVKKHEPISSLQFEQSRIRYICGSKDIVWHRPILNGFE